MIIIHDDDTDKVYFIIGIKPYIIDRKILWIVIGAFFYTLIVLTTLGVF